MCPDVKTARRHREGCEAGRCQERGVGQSHCSFGRCGGPLQRPVGQTKGSSCHRRGAGLLRRKRLRHGDRSSGTMVACRQAGEFLARIIGSVLLEGGRQSFARPHGAIVGDRHVEIGDCRGTTDPACLPTVNHRGKCEVPANCCWHVGQALGRSPASSFHSCGYGGAIYTKSRIGARGNVRRSRG